ncbi:MAG: malto-oligosyltrehalose synthase [Deltaproteobacteria bacterium]|nr:malto-oligosyltrehalose synthase [Deltaproteobacteria bacterium]
MRAPSSTYRLQLTPSFTLADARAVAAFLADLGISHVYASPLFAARPGSTHGYDVLDPTRVNPELGGEEALEALSGELARRGMGLVLDIVPSHMALDARGPWLADLCLHGEHSGYKHFFDVDWEHPDPGLRAKLLVPILGKPLGRCLEDGELAIVHGEDGFACAYYEHRFPLLAETWADVLGWVDREGGKYALFLEGVHKDLSRALSAADGPTRRRGIESARTRLAELLAEDAGFARWFSRRMKALNQQQADGSFPAARILEGQVFRLALFSMAFTEINYRRFFHINGLICLRVQDPAVFDAVHRKALELVEKDLVSGLRVDHVDGLADPAGYLARLADKAPNAWVVVEKILAQDELPRPDWKAAGTTGYEFAAAVSHLFCPPENGAALDRIYREFTGRVAEYKDILKHKKERVVDEYMAGDLDNAARAFWKLAQTSLHAKDFTQTGVARALRALAGRMGVYRTYVTAKGASPEDVERIRRAGEKAREDRPDLAGEVDFCCRVMALDWPDAEAAARCADLFQKLSAPVFAKGMEDAALYVYNRFLAHNEVGGDPGRFGLSVEDFHAFLQTRLKTTPHAMNATSTHDTKRGEDVRVRLCVLAEIPREWERRVNAWKKANRDKKRRVDGVEAPDANEEYFLYQTLLGAWPLDPGEMDAFPGRVADYMVKALREAGEHSGWVLPNEEYEQAVVDFAREIIAHPAFLKEFAAFCQKVSAWGAVNSLAQVLLKAAAPGVPDFYQGCELYNLSLVDPDNRRPVDYGRRAGMLEALDRSLEADRAAAIRDMLENYRDGRAKLFATRELLRARNRMPDLFARGEYLPMAARGPRSGCVAAFARRHESRWAVALAPRFPATLAPEGGFFDPGGFAGTKAVLPMGAPRSLKQIFSGKLLDTQGEIPLDRAFAAFPVALYVGET